MKIDLLPPISGDGRLPHEMFCSDSRQRHAYLRRALPYFQTARGQYVHRVRSGVVFLWEDTPTHTAIHLWCGQTAYCGGPGLLYGQHKHRRRETGAFMILPAATDIVCSTCEGRAIGTGLFSTPFINGKPVRFAPRSTPTALHQAETDG